MNTLKKSQWRQIILGSTILALVFCIPLLNGSLRYGSDTSFHLNRIIALSTALKNGDLYPRVFWDQNYGFGYGSPSFYSFFFLYLPAWLYLQGMGILPAFRIFTFLVVFFCALSMCILSWHISSGSLKCAWISAAMYLYNPFFFSNVYKRGAVGEELAYIFVPLVLLAAYDLFYAEEKGRHWQLLIVSFAGLLLSHNITFLIMSGVFAVIVMVNWKQWTHDRSILLKLLAATGITVCLTSFFTFPMLEQLSGRIYRISSYFGDGSTMASSAMPVLSYLDLNLGSDIYFNGALGPYLVFAPLSLFFLPHKERKPFFVLILAVGYGLGFLNTNLFPWAWVHIFDFMQFPTRFLNAACAFLAAAGGCGLSLLELPQDKHRIASKTLLVLSAVLLSISIFQLWQVGGVFNDRTTAADLTDDEKYVYVQVHWYNVMELSTPDYLPSDTDISYPNYGRVIKINADNLREMDESKYGVLSFSTENTIGNGVYVVPKTYYKGYAAAAYRNGQYLGNYPVSMDPKTGCVRFTVQNADEPVTIFVTYYGTGCQKLSDLLSWATLILWLAFRFLRRRKGYPAKAAERS